MPQHDIALARLLGRVVAPRIEVSAIVHDALSSPVLDSSAPSWRARLPTKLRRWNDGGQRSRFLNRIRNLNPDLADGMQALMPAMLGSATSSPSCIFAIPSHHRFRAAFEISLCEHRSGTGGSPRGSELPQPPARRIRPASPRPCRSRSKSARRPVQTGRSVRARASGDPDLSGLRRAAICRWRRLCLQKPNLSAVQALRIVPVVAAEQDLGCRIAATRAPEFHDWP